MINVPIEPFSEQSVLRPQGWLTQMLVQASATDVALLMIAIARAEREDQTQ
jgi:hypothetical protein